MTLIQIQTNIQTNQKEPHNKQETFIESLTRVPPKEVALPQPELSALIISQFPPDLNPRTNPDPKVTIITITTMTTAITKQYHNVVPITIRTTSTSERSVLITIK